MSSIDDLNKLLNERNLASSRIVDCAKKIFKEELPKLFNEFPGVETISWRQYTPYFNDGSPCEFNVYIDEEGIDINGLEYYDVDESLQDSHREIAMRFCEIVNKIPNDVFLKLFGDHTQVTISRSSKGIIVEPCEHD